MSKGFWTSKRERMKIPNLWPFQNPEEFEIWIKDGQAGIDRLRKERTLDKKEQVKIMDKVEKDRHLLYEANPIMGAKKCAADIYGIAKTIQGELDRIDRSIWNNADLSQMEVDLYMDAFSEVQDCVRRLHSLRAQVIIRLMDEKGISIADG